MRIFLSYTLFWINFVYFYFSERESSSLEVENMDWILFHFCKRLKIIHFQLVDVYVKLVEFENVKIK
jgi:hypothetical protein